MKPTVLIADGDAVLCAVYQNFLTGRGYNVAIASDGLDCLEKLRRLVPAVLVLDLDLRWGGGDGILAWLREEGAVSGVVVVVTATAADSLAIDGDIQPPVIRFLPKPFALTALLESVCIAVAKKRREARFNLNWAPGYSEVFTS